MATDVQFPVSRIVSVNPATGEVLGELESAGLAEVHAAVAAAHAAQPEWNSLGVRKRLGVLRDFQQLLLGRKTEIAHRITQEAGKPQVEALVTEVLVVLDAARFLIENAFALLRDEPLPHGNVALKTKSGRILHEPYGVIGIISPWNYPFSIPATEAMTALVAGNAVVLKPSELTPLIAFELQELLREAGVPRNIFQVLPGDGATGAALVKSGIDKLVFTGSVATGRRIAQIAGERLLPVVLELGGKGSDAGARRCRRRRGIERRGVGSFHERGPDLPFGRALLRASQVVCGVRRGLRREGSQTARGKWGRSGRRCWSDDSRAAGADRGSARGRCTTARRSRGGWRRTLTGNRTDVFCSHRACRCRSHHAHHARRNVRAGAANCSV